MFNKISVNDYEDQLIFPQTNPSIHIISAKAGAL